MLHYVASPPADFCFLSMLSSGMELPMDRMTGEFAASDARDELAAVLVAVSRGDRSAFARLYERTAAKLYGICLRLMHNEAEAQEVLQETYLTVWRKADRFDPAKASPITWLAVLARNSALDRLRRRSLGLDELEAAANVPDGDPSAFAVMVAEQDSVRLRHCLDTLDERARAMIRSAFLDGASYPDLAAREGVPLGTMKSWIRRGLQRLRGCLEE
jgi:RNA polymerase sigma-70 factor (ECF subfamily)